MTLDPQALTAAAEAEARYDGYDDLLSFSKTTRERYIDRVDAAITAYLAVGWQDISTAPKDTPIFLWGYLEVSSQSRPLIGSDDRYEAFWDAEVEAWRCYTYEGWIVSPFAWMPLPPPFKGSGSRLADANSKSPTQAREE